MWIRSRFCNGASACVEVRPPCEETGGMWQMRDSKDPDGAVLSFTEEEMDAFKAGVRDEEFELSVLAAAAHDATDGVSGGPVAASGVDPVPA